MAEKEILELILDKLGVIEDETKGIKKDVIRLQEDIVELKSDMSEVKADIVELKADMSEVKADIVELKADMSEVKADIVELKSDMSVVKEDIIGLKADASAQRYDVDSTRIVLENEISKEIRIIAENHLALNQKLDEVLETMHPNTMYHLKVDYHDREIKRIKKVVGMD